MTVTAELRVKFSAVKVGSNDLGNPEQRPSLEKILQFASGVASDQADIVFTDTRTVGISANDDLDLAGVLTDAFGAAITAVEMVGMIIINKSTTQTLTIGAGSNPWITWLIATGDGIKIPPRGVFVLFAPDASGLGTVTAGTGDILRVANGAGFAADYDIALLARTA